MNATSTLRPLLGLLVASTAALGAAACGGSGTDSDQAAPNNTADQATITGYLTMSQRAGAGGDQGGVDVQAYQVQADGALLPLTAAGTQTDDSGLYTMTINLPTDGARDFMVEATRSGQTVGSVLVVGLMQSEQERQLEPITIETSVEADIYIAALSAGKWDQATCTTTGLKHLISPALASDIDTTGVDNESINAAASASTAAMMAWAKTLRDESIGAHEQTLRNALGHQEALQIEFDAARFDNFAAGGAGPDAKTFDTAAVETWNEAGLSLEVLGAAAIASADAFGVYAVMMNDDAQAQASIDAEIHTARRLTYLIEAQAQRAQLQPTALDALGQAGLALKDALGELARQDGDVTRELSDAWGVYEASVKTVLRSGLNSEQVEVYQRVADSLQGARESFAASIDTQRPGNPAEQTAANVAKASVELRGKVVEDRNLDALAAFMDGERAEATLEILFALSATAP